MLAVVLLAFGIACYILFTPARLTPLVNRIVGNYITCDYEIGRVELTFFSTFPHLGVRIDGLTVVNPLEGAQSDTVLHAQAVTATFNLKELIFDNNLIVSEAVLENADLNYFVAQDGTTNFDIFVTEPEDSTQVTEEVTDTTSSALPFENLQVDGLRIEARRVTYLDRQDTIYASLGTSTLSAYAQSWNDMYVDLQASDVCAVLQGETYADSVRLTLVSRVGTCLDSMRFDLDQARLSWNQFAMTLDGEITLGDSTSLDVRLVTQDTWPIEPLMTTLPHSWVESLEEYHLSGTLALDASVNGVISETQMPVVTIHPSYADLWHSRLDLDGTVSEMETDMCFDLNLRLKGPITDYKPFLSDMDLSGTLKASMDARIHLSDLTQMQLDKGTIRAKMDMSSLRYTTEDMLVSIPNTHASLQIPNPTPSKPKVNWARVDIEADRINLEMDSSLNGMLHESTILLEAGDILSDNPVLYAALDLQSERPMEASMDSAYALIDAPKFTAYTEYNTKDTTVMPVIKAALKCDVLEGFYYDYKADLGATSLDASLSGGRKDKSAPRAKISLETSSLQARIGDDIKGSTGLLSLKVGARYHAKEENILLQWSPLLKIKLSNGEFHLPQAVPEPVYIPSIDFSYTNREMTINNSRIEVGNSDLNLQGDVRQIGAWLRNEEVLEGELNITSNHCDASQLMAWISEDKGSEEEDEPVAENVSSEEVPASSEPSPVTTDSAEEEPKPFLVPQKVNVALNTHLKEVEWNGETARDLHGGIYINRGTLLLDEVGFICRAAKLQLSAMYRSPRKNHLYLGFDYHMVDVDIDELRGMIPMVDSTMPMLRSFGGDVQFHLAAETYLNSRYEPKMSTLRGASSITGTDLIIRDSKEFNEIARLLVLKKKPVNTVDSINAEVTIYKNEIDVYPLCAQVNDYMVALGGRHNTNMTFNYDINVLKPIYVGLNISGNIDSLQYKLVKCKFAQDFRPHWYQKADTQGRELRERIKKSMERNVRIKSDKSPNNNNQ